MILHLALAYAKGTRIGDRPAQSRHLAAQTEPCDRATAGPNASSGVVQKPASNIQRNAASVGTRQVDPRGHAWRWLCQRSFRSPGSAMACSFEPMGTGQAMQKPARTLMLIIELLQFHLTAFGSALMAAGRCEGQRPFVTKSQMRLPSPLSGTACPPFATPRAQLRPVTRFGRDDTCGLLQTRSNPRW